jgi:hypothetical protein
MSAYEGGGVRQHRNEQLKDARDHFQAQVSVPIQWMILYVSEPYWVESHDRATSVCQCVRFALCMEPQEHTISGAGTAAVACAIPPVQRAIVSVFADSDGRIGRIKRRMCMQDTDRCDVCNKDSSMLSLLFCAVL